MEKKHLVYTNENCLGCNKCINVCSSLGACLSVEMGKKGVFRIEVDPERCIACGACFDACNHDAREYKDDTEAFFDALKSGEKISLLIAPSFAANYPDVYESVLGGLKAAGVGRIINVAFGADITTWGYLKYIEEHKFTGGISSPCPVVVNYIERYEPGLIKKLLPVHSPLLCAAIYARKELGITDTLAFLGPCIAKKMEINDPEAKGIVSYNVTFRQLMKYVKSHHLYGESCLAEMEYGLGGIFPMPGGLKENMLWLLGEETFVRQIEGEKRLYQYLKKNAEKIENGETGFFMIDALNCTGGCLAGPAVETRHHGEDEALLNLLQQRKNMKGEMVDSAWRKELMPEERRKALNEAFSGLDLKDYMRGFTDRSANAVVYEPSEEEIDRVFLRMKKETEDSRKINCSACGNDTCRDMAVAIYNGFNHRRNCVHYLKDLVEEEQAELRYRAEYDHFLGIMNRRTVSDWLANSVKATDVFSILIADINGFKGINSTYGTLAGDVVLKQVTENVKRMCEEQEFLVARYGGDEFLFYIEGKLLSKGSPEIALVQEAITRPVKYHDEKISVTVSIGISASDGVTTPEEHVLAAEHAMYLTKTFGTNTVLEFSKAQKQKAKEELEIRDKVQDALENNGFYMVYQPKVDAATKTVCGFEALVRMKTPSVYPGQFIPIAEKNGWIWKIGRITTELTVRQLALWQAEGHTLHPVSVNFSSNQLNDEGYVDFLEGLLKKYGIPPKYLEIEITEGLFLDKTAQAQKLFERFQKLGIRLLMDDFGTGYSSLGYLTYIPVDVIKLDKSLVDNYLVDGKASFIKNVIHLIHDLDKEMLIEGVEEKWQYDKLCEFGADTIQGYYFSKPIPADEAILFEVKT